MKRFLSLVMVPLAVAALEVVLAHAAEAGSETGSVAASGPRAEFSQTTVDFGKVMPTELQKHDFVVTNTGSEPLEISNVSPGCGCTTAGEWDREIAPGKTGKIPVAFNPSNFSGVITKAVTVSTNDRTRPTHVLEIKAIVWRPFLVQPAFANFLPVEGEPANETKIIRIVNNAPQAATLQPPVSSDPQFKTELKTIRPGMEFELHVTYDSANGAASPSATITVDTSSKDQPVLTVTAFAMPQPAVVVIPATLQIPSDTAGQNYNHNIVIRNNGNAALAITDAMATHDGVAVKISEGQPGKLFYVNVGLPEKFKASDDRPVEIIVKTSHPKFPEVRVPVVFSAAFGAPAPNRVPGRR